MDDEVDSITIPVIEEELNVARETVETGKVRVRTIPQERIETVTESLLRTDVEVERLHIGREIEEMPPLRDEGDSIVVPVVEERLVKKLFLVEEVRLTRRTSTHDIDEQIKLRSQQVVVEREKSSGDTATKE